MLVDLSFAQFVLDDNTASVHCVFLEGSFAVPDYRMWVTNKSGKPVVPTLTYVNPYMLPPQESGGPQSMWKWKLRL